VGAASEYCCGGDGAVGKGATGATQRLDISRCRSTFAAGTILNWRLARKSSQGTSL